MSNSDPHPMSEMSLTYRIIAACDGPHPAADVHTGHLTELGAQSLSLYARATRSLPFIRKCAEYAQLVGLVTPVGLMADLTTEDERMCDVILSHEGPRTMPPQPTCHHTDGMCEHMVCPREYGQGGAVESTHFTPAYYQRFGW